MKENRVALKPLKRWRFILGLVLLCTSVVSIAQERPASVKVIDHPGATFSLDSITYAPGTSPDKSQPASGTGNLVVSSPGGNGRADAALFSGLKHAADGSVAEVTITLTNDLRISDLGKSGIDVVALKTSTLKWVAATGLTASAAAGATALELGLPFRTDNDVFVAIGTQQFSIVKSATGLTINAIGASVLRPVATKKIELGNVSVSSTGLADLTATIPNLGSATFRATLRQAMASISIPALLTANEKPWTASVNELAVDQDGRVTFARANLTSNQTVKLTNPAGFELIVRDGSSIEMLDGLPVGFTLNCDLKFPEDITDANGERLVVTGISTAANNGKGVLITVSQPPPMKVKGFLVTCQTIGLDLSPSDILPLPPSAPAFVRSKGFTGGYIQSADVLLPDTLTKANGDPITVTVADLAIEGEGLTGKIGLSGVNVQAIAGFEAKNVAGDIDLKRSRITGCTIQGELVVPLSSDPSPTKKSTVGVAISIQDDGYLSVDVKPDYKLNLDSVGAELTIKRGRLIVEDGEPRIFVSGNFQLTRVPAIPGLPDLKPVLQGTKFALDDIGFNSDGKLYLPSSGSVNFSNPLVIDLKVVKLMCKSIGFEADDTGLDAVTLGGGIELGEGLDIPISGGITFEGLRIGKPDSQGGMPKLSIGDIGVELEINQLMVATGRLSFLDDAKRLEMKAGSGLGNGFAGYAKLGIADLGAVDVFLMITDKAWFVGGGIETPPITIQIPPSPGNPPVPLFNIYGFFGGFGVNVRAKAGEGRITELNQIEFDDGQFLAQAGMIFGDQITGNVWWGEGTLTVGFPALVIDLTAKLSFLDFNGPGLVSASYWDEADRMAIIFANLDLSKLPEVTFLAGGEVFVGLPSRKDSLITMDGEALLKISSKEAFLMVGWEDKGQKPVRLKFGEMVDGVDLEVKGGFLLDFLEPRFSLEFAGTLEVDLGLTIDARVNGSMVIKPSKSALLNGQTDFLKMPDMSGNLEISGSVYFPEFPDICASAYARLKGDLKTTSSQTRLRVSGEVEGSVRVFGKKVPVGADFDEVLMKVNR